jgi:hypothetical protein
VISTRLLLLGIAAAAVDLGSVYVKVPVGPAGVTLGDWIFGSGAYLTLALYVWVAAGVGACRAPPSLLLVAAGITYALGTGIHLAANSIHDMLEETGGADPWKLVYFWDETAGHYLVDTARVGFAVALTWMEGGGSPERDGGSSGRRSSASTLAVLAGALAYGFIYFATAVEGQTVAIALPFTLLYAAWSVITGSSGDGSKGLKPVRAFYTAAALVSLALFAAWGVSHRGFPEFSRTGFIR